MKKLVIIITILCGTLCQAAERPAKVLSKILSECLQRERITPDSLYYNIELLESYRSEQTGVAHAITTAALARLYAERSYLAQTYSRETKSHPDSIRQWSTQEWLQQSQTLFRQSLSDLEILHGEKTSKWLPLVSRGRDEDIFRSDMLYVVWHAAEIALPYDVVQSDSLLNAERIISFYRNKGMKKAVLFLENEKKIFTPPSNNPLLMGSMARDYYPGDSIRMRLRHRNMQSLELRIYSIHDTLDVLDDNFLKKVKKRGRLIRKETPTITELSDTTIYGDTIRLQGLPIGHYAITIEGKTGADLLGKPEQEVIDFWVRRQKVVMMELPGKGTRLWMVDAKSGAPMDTLEWDTTGMTARYRESKPDNVLRHNVRFYTDRPIYRPGQVVHVAGVVYSQKDWEVLAKENCLMIVKMLDTNRRLVASDTMRSDEFGVFSSRFTIPKDARPGSFSIKVANSTLWIRVEEYKRPSFYISTDEMKENDSIVSGIVKNYSGAPLVNARVTATAMFYFSKEPYSVRKELDTIYTDFQGRFSYSLKVAHTSYRGCSVGLTVLSPTGESQRASVSTPYSLPPTHDTKTSDPWKGTLDSPVYLFHTLVAANKLLRDTMWVVRDSISLPEIPYRDSYGHGAVATYFYVKNGTLVSKKVEIKKPLPKDTLQYHWQTFRDKLEPGSHEHWTLKVTRKDGTPVKANVMATLYDASLNALQPNKWSFNIYRQYWLPTTYLRALGEFDDNDYLFFNYSMRPSYEKFNEMYFSHFNEAYFLNDRRDFGNVLLKKVPVNAKICGYAALSMAETDAVLNGKIAGIENPKTEEEQIQMRSDFSETSFFEPRLRTGSDGCVDICFTLPESLTTWSLRLLAHTKTMENIVGEEVIVAQRNIMAQLQLPRFVRQGDKITVSATVTNISETSEEGKAQLVVKDARTENVLQRETFRYSLKAKSDTLYHITLNGTYTDDIICQFTAGNDGEQHLLPVLSSKETLTESKALTLAPGEEQQVNIDALFPQGAKRKRVIVEQTSSPVWLAIEALPQMTLPESDNSISLSQVFFAETLMEIIPRFMPSADSLLRARQCQYSREYCITHIAALQKSDGGISWFPGMNASVWATRMVVRTISRLQFLLKGEAQDEAMQQATRVAEKAREWLQKKGVDAYKIPTRHEADSLLALLPHSDGYYLAFPGGWKTSIDERLMRNVEALETIESIYPERQDVCRGIRTWILRQKRTQGWKTPMACVEAVYALLRNGDLLNASSMPPHQRDTLSLDAKTYKFVNKGKYEAWAAVYAEYETDVDKVQTSASGIRVTRSSEQGSHRVGEKIPVRLLLSADRNYEFVRVSVARSSLTEPMQQRSGYGFKDGLFFYREIHDTTTDYYIEHLPQGTYILEDEQQVVRTGTAHSGITKVECLYAPEFRSHTDEEVVKTTR